MKFASLFTASAAVLALGTSAYAQTAPTTTTTPTTPTTPAPTPAPAPTGGIPAPFVNVPAIQQVDAQLTAQGYTITDVVQNADGSYSILSRGPNGDLRLITVNPTTGAVTDTVNTGVPAGTNGVGPNGTFDDDDDDDDDENDDDDDNGDDDDGGNDDDGGDDDDDGGDDD